MSRSKDICTVDSCTRVVNGRGLCTTHATRLRNHGDINVCLTNIHLSFLERFWLKVTKGEGCWTWTGSILKSGYGNIRDGSKVKRAHRVSYEIHFGPIPEGMQVDHICRNRSCVKPSHLRQATNKQNQENRDHLSRKGHPRGVSFSKGRYRARVMHHRTMHLIGTFDTPEEASAAVLLKRNELFTHNDDDRAVTIEGLDK